jgi:hypothetical protein
LGRLNVGIMDTRSRLRAVLAALIAPAVILLLFAGTRPYGIQMSLPLTLAAYALAHVFFWPPAVAATLVGRRLRFKSMSQLVLLMGGFSAVLSLVLGIPFVYLHVTTPSYTWHRDIRDALDLGVVGAGAFILYRLLLGQAAGDSSAVKALASIDLMYSDRRPVVDVRATVSLLSSVETGRCNDWRPRHNFGPPDSHFFYIGKIDLGSKPINPGETRQVLVRFLDGPGLRDNLRPGRTWRIQEGSNLIATAEVVELVGGT